MRHRVESPSGNKDGWGLLYLPNVGESGDKTGIAVGFLYKERRVQVFDSDSNIFRALEDTKLRRVVKLLLEF